MGGRKSRALSSRVLPVGLLRLFLLLLCLLWLLLLRWLGLLRLLRLRRLLCWVGRCRGRARVLCGLLKAGVG